MSEHFPSHLSTTHSLRTSFTLFALRPTGGVPNLRAQSPPSIIGQTEPRRTDAARGTWRQNAARMSRQGWTSRQSSFNIFPFYRARRSLCVSCPTTIVRYVTTAVCVCAAYANNLYDITIIIINYTIIVHVFIATPSSRSRSAVGRGSLFFRSLE